MELLLVLVPSMLLPPTGGPYTRTTGGPFTRTGGVVAVEGFAGRPGSCAPSPTPTCGEEAWGRWRHSMNEISIEIFLDARVRASELAVELDEGWLCVGPPLDAAIDVCSLVSSSGPLRGRLIEIDGSRSLFAGRSERRAAALREARATSARR